MVFLCYSAHTMILLWLYPVFVDLITRPIVANQRAQTLLPKAIYYFGNLVINDLFNFGLKGVCIPLNNHRLCHVLLWALKYNDDSCQNANQMLL